MRLTPACARTLKLPIRLHEGKTRTIVILRTAGFVSRKISVVPPFRRPGRTTVREARTGLRDTAPSHGSGGQLSVASVKGPTDPAAPPPEADVVPPVCVPPVAREDEVLMLMRRYGPVRGVRQLRSLLPLVDAGAESLKESSLRLLLIDNGFPIPETQIPVSEGVEPFAYLDMGWRDLQLAVEYDGDQHRTDRPQYVKDLRRIPKVERCGWELVRVINEDRPFQILRRVYDAYVRRGAPEIDKMARFTRTPSPKRWFGRNEGSAA